MSKRGIRRASVRARLAVAAAVLAGGGAAGAVAVAVSHSGTATAEAAGYYQTSGRTLSYTTAMSSAVSGWSRSPSTSLMTISHMKPVTSYWTQSWHRAVIFIQRGTVVAAGRGEFVVRSANGSFEIWHVNRATRTLNVGSSSTGMSAMTGGTTRVPHGWIMNMKVKGIAKGDLVFVFGERENHTLKAQLVLFAAPAMTARPAVTPAARATTPMATPTNPMATPTTRMATPATSMATPTGTMTAPAVMPTGTAVTFSGNHS
jgi:hypothetical protein